MDYSVVYQTLIKPSFAPPPWVFGLTWTILYILIGIAAVLLIKKLIKKKLPTSIFVLFVMNIVANILFMPFQTMAPTLMPATIILFIIVFTLASLLIVLPRYSKIATWLLIPYYIWVIFATTLQISIIALN